VTTPRPQRRRRNSAEQPELRVGAVPLGDLEPLAVRADDRAVTPQAFTMIRRLGRMSTMQVRALCELLWAERALDNAAIEGFALFALDSAGLTRWFPDMRELAVALGYRLCPVPQLAELAVYAAGTIYYRASLGGTDLQWAVAHELAHALLADYCADEYLHSDVQALTLALFFTRDHLRHFVLNGGVNVAIRASSRRCRAWVVRFRWVLLRSNAAIAA
jgi:hypothetical protein